MRPVRLSPKTLFARAREQGLDAKHYLSRNDAYNFFKETGGLFVTGPTHTNVCDLASGAGGSIPPPLIRRQLLEFAGDAGFFRPRPFHLPGDSSGLIASVGRICTPPPIGVISVMPFQIAFTADSTCCGGLSVSTG